MDAADILVLPSLPTKQWQEQYGRVVPEAQACKTAILASDSGGIPEAAGRIGEFVRPGDAKDIATSLISLIQDDTYREQLQEDGRHRIEEELTVERTSTRLQNIYRSLLKNESA
jgi:glycosyltransferase involved in cell wall biosynthesis